MRDVPGTGSQITRRPFSLRSGGHLVSTRLSITDRLTSGIGAYALPLSSEQLMAKPDTPPSSLPKQPGLPPKPIRPKPKRGKPTSVSLKALAKPSNQSQPNGLIRKPAAFVDAKHADLKEKAGRFRVLIIGRANAGKTTILKKICDTTEDPEIYTSDGTKVSRL